MGDSEDGSQRGDGLRAGGSNSTGRTGHLDGGHVDRWPEGFGPIVSGSLSDLTDAQRRVAAAAVAGLSNREVAQRLGVSERTVESHLRTVFRKLGVKRRQQLKLRLELKNWRGRTEAAPDQLTPREAEVAMLVGRGMSDKMVAARLRISVRTAESHVAQVLHKLGFTSRSQIISWIHSQPRPSANAIPP